MNEANNQACQWKYCESECSWDTQCNNKYQFMNDGPKENDYKFCPGCGKPVTLAGDREPATSKTPEPSTLASATGSETPDALIVAFVQGAKWWEYHQTGATMWASDQDQAEGHAEEMARNGTLGKSPNAEPSHGKNDQ